MFGIKGLKERKKNKTQRVIQDLLSKNESLKKELEDSENTLEYKLLLLDKLINENEAYRSMFADSVKGLEKAKEEYEIAKRDFLVMKEEYERDMNELLKGV